jgi:hypothetical protein
MKSILLYILGVFIGYSMAQVEDKYFDQHSVAAIAKEKE